MLETDSPYLTPRTIKPRPKSRRNEPAFLTAVLAIVASALGKTRHVVAHDTSAVAERFFGLPRPAGAMP
jgi:TatD DNase family protein